MSGEMPQGDTSRPNLMDVVDDLIDRGVNGITSLRALAQRIHELDPRKSAEDWRRALRRYRGNVEPSEEVYELIAAAFAVSRESLPASRGRLTLAGMDRRMQRVEAELDEAHSVVGRILAALADANISLPGGEDAPPGTTTGRPSN